MQVQYGVRETPAASPQHHSALVVNISDASSGGANETFRQRWQTVLEASPESPRTSEERRSAENPFRAAAGSAKVPTAVVESTPRTVNENTAHATEKTALGECAQTSASPVFGDLQDIFPLPNSIRADSSHLQGKGRAEVVSAHPQGSSRKAGASARQQVAVVENTTIASPDSFLMSCQSTAPQAGVPPLSEKMSLQETAASEVLNRSGNSPGNHDADVSGRASIEPPLSFKVSRNIGTSRTAIKSEQNALRASLSSDFTSANGNPVPEDAGALIAAFPSSTEVEPKRPMRDEQSDRPAVSQLPETVSASEPPMKATVTAETNLDSVVEIRQPTTRPVRNQPLRPDGAARTALFSSTPAKNLSAPFNESQAISDAATTAFGQAHGSAIPGPLAAATASSPSGDALSPAKAAAAPSHEPFAAMDVEMKDGATKWIRADSHNAEAGFQDASLGWVSVRAQSGAGGIHAAVMPSSEGAAETLRSSLAGLNAHMATHYARVNAVNVSDPVVGWNNQSTGRGPADENGGSPSDGGRHRAYESSAPPSSEPPGQIIRHRAEEIKTLELPLFSAHESV